MQNSHEKLVEDIERFLRRHEMAPTTFGVQAINDRHLVRRLRKGSSVNLKTADRIRAYMRAGPRRPSKPAEARAFG